VIAKWIITRRDSFNLKDGKVTKCGNEMMTRSGGIIIYP
jgi:hypothetical protein